MSWKYYKHEDKLLTWNHMPIREWVDDSFIYPTDSLYAYYPFTEDFKDEYSNKDLIQVGNVDIGNYAPWGKCVSVYTNNDTPNNRLEYRSGTDLRNSFSISCWFKNVSLSPNWDTLFISSYNRNTYNVLVGGRNVVFSICKCTGAECSEKKLNSALNDGLWRHLLLTVNTTSNEYSLWLNNVNVINKWKPSYTQALTGTGYTIFEHNARFCVSDFYIYTKILGNDERNILYSQHSNEI